MIALEHDINIMCLVLSPNMSSRMMTRTQILSQKREVLVRFVDARLFKRCTIALILISALLLGAETFRGLGPEVLGILYRTNQVILGIFVIELLLRIIAHGRAFFREPWNLFDLVIVAGAVIPPPGPLQVLRALRVLRSLRLIANVPSMRRVVDGLLNAIPSLASVVLLLVFLLYVSAVMATHFFRDASPEFFGDLGTSLYTLFQVMTLENWPDVAASVQASHSWSWLFFVIYILIATFMVLNLFIGVMVAGIRMRIESEQEEQAMDKPQLDREFSELRSEMAELRKELERARTGQS